MHEEYERLIAKLKSIGKEYNWELLDKAYKAAVEAHAGQLRSSGEPFVIHPLQVTYILAEMEMIPPPLLQECSTTQLRTHLLPMRKI